MTALKEKGHFLLRTYLLLRVCYFFPPLWDRDQHTHTLSPFPLPAPFFCRAAPLPPHHNHYCSIIKIQQP